MLILLYLLGSCLHSEKSACCCALKTQRRRSSRREGVKVGGFHAKKAAGFNALIPVMTPEVTPVSPQCERSDGSSAADYIV